MISPAFLIEPGHRLGNEARIGAGRLHRRGISLETTDDVIRIYTSPDDGIEFLPGGLFRIGIRRPRWVASPEALELFNGISS